MDEATLVTINTDASGRPRKLILSRAGLRVLAGPEQNQLFEITSTPMLIGTHRTCDLVLGDSSISSRHAEVGLRPAGYLLRDLGSRNGTYVGSWRVEQIYLSPGMMVTMGKTLMEVVDLHQVTEVELSDKDQFGGIIGRSVVMRQLFALLEAASRSEATVLLHGETGTGKEVLADAIHLASDRAGGPFVVFDCGAVPDNLVESELFGHERGAFTGATTSRAGALERADGGTLFLDEIGELRLDLQPKLLRAMETHCAQRLGGSTTRELDIRVIAATHRNLEHEVAHGRFRDDLYYRLAVLRIRVPPLRERPDDLPLLIEYFARLFGAEVELGDRFPGLVPLLQSYSWPGNVRELRNVVERLCVLPLEQALPSAVLVPPRESAPVPYTDARDRALDQFERAYLEDLLRRTSGNVTRAAELAAVSRRYLTRLLAKHPILRRGLGPDAS